MPAPSDRASHPTTAAASATGPDAGAPGAQAPIWYLHPFHFPAEHAHAVQILHTCRALAEAGAPVRLLVKRSPREPLADPVRGLARYGLEPHPRWRIDFLPSTHNGVAGLAARWRVWRARGVRFYARHERLARTAARGGGGPVVIELHNVGPDTARTLARVDGVVTITRALAERARALAAPRTLPCEVIPDGFDPSLFRPVVAPAGAGGPDPPRAVYTGQLLDWKGVDVLLRALALVGEPGLRALVVGGRSGADPEGERLRGLARELGVADRVTWTGPLPHRDVASHLRPGDIAVVPTRARHGQELAASPLKLFEAMASGLPVVASDLPALRDVVEDGANGLLFAEGDAGALAAALRRLRDDAVLRRRLGERARLDAVRYAWPERARRILGFFASLPTASRRPEARRR